MAELLRTTPESDEWGFLEAHLREGMRANFDDPYARSMMPKPYEYADMQLMKLNPNFIKPTAKYVLKKNLEVIRKLREELLKGGFDIFSLRGILKIDDNNLICPPVLEVWGYAPFNGVPVVVDGAHRLFLAREFGLEVNCVVISGNRIAHMLPVLPLRGWSQVVVQNEVPKDKRNYDPMIPSHVKPHELYRLPFPGSTGPRLATTNLTQSEG